MDSGMEGGTGRRDRGRSAVCTIDGGAGRLYYRGYEIGDLAARAAFEDVTHLLWFGELPVRGAPGSARGCRGPRACRRRWWPCYVLCRATRIRLTRSAPPCRSRRRSIPTRRPSEPDANVRKSLRLMTLVPATVAAWHACAGRDAGGAHGRGSHAARFLTCSAAGAGAGRRASPRRRADPPRRPRVQRLDLRGAGGRRHPGRSARGRRGRRCHAQGASSRRRQRGRAVDAEGDRRSCPGGGLRREPARRAGTPCRSSERGDPKARMPGSVIASTGSTTRGRACCAGWRSRWRRRPGETRLFEVAERLYEAMRARTGLPVNVDFFSAVVYDAPRHPARSLHVHLRGGAHRRLVRPRSRAVRRQPPHPPPRRLYGAPPRAPCRR